ncbi:MAG: TRAP transporter substrate-binding protein, partial [Microbacteriaceae bacterium]|nr:TRAP transporter substrate-binding protein [Burkholderiaceae bacterium]
MTFTRRHFPTTSALAGSAALPGLVSAQTAKPPEFKLKLGTDLPATHSVNVRLKEAIGAIAAESGGRLAVD